MTNAFDLIVEALREQPEGWEDTVREQFYCTLPGEWPLIQILAKGYLGGGGGLEGSEGGNGAADAGKAALFSGNGGLRGETLTSDDYVQVGDGSTVDGSVLILNNSGGIAQIRADNLTDERVIQFQDQGGTVALLTDVTGLLDFKGTTDASGNPNYPAASKGDFYLVSVAGRVGGASGAIVEAGDSFYAIADNAGGTQAGVGTSWAIVQGNTLSASSTQAGIVELSTDAEAITGAATDRAITPANLTARLGATGALAGVTSITGGASNMNILSGTGNSRTLTLQTTTSGGVATNAVVISDTQRVTVSSTETAVSSASAAFVVAGGVAVGQSIIANTNVQANNALLGGYVGAVAGGVVQLIGSSAGASVTRTTFDFTPSASTMAFDISASSISVNRGDGTAGGTFNVTGTMTANSITSTTSITPGATSFIAWGSRSRLYSPSNGKLELSNGAHTTGVTLDFVTADTLKVRNFADSTDGTLTAGTVNVTGALNVAGATTLTAGTATSSATTGTLVVTGGIGVSNNIYATGNITSVGLFDSVGGLGYRNAATNAYYWNGRGVLRSTAAAAVTIGANDSATPLANTLTIGESSRAGTDTNVGGANGIIASGTGTGTGTGSGLIFQTPTVTGSGSGAQTLATRLIISSASASFFSGNAVISAAGAATFSGPVTLKGYTVATLPAGTVGMTAYVTDATAPTYLGALTGGGAVVCPVFYNGSAWVSH